MPNNTVYTKTNPISAMQKLPGTLKVDVLAYAVEIKFLQGPSQHIW